MSKFPIDDPGLWKSFINSIPQDLSLKGLDAPDMENEHEVSTAGDMEGGLIKVSFDLYMFFSPKNTKYYMIQSKQRFQDMGETTLGEAIKTIKKRNK